MNVMDIVTPLGFWTIVLAAAGAMSIFCRLGVMDPARTQRVVVVQHAVLGIGLFTALMTSLEWEFAREYGAHGWMIDLLENRQLGMLVLVASVLFFLLMSSHRWRFVQPDGTKRPDPRSAWLDV